MFRKVVLNPLSHTGISQLSDVEIRGAIAAVAGMQFEVMTHLARATEQCFVPRNKFMPGTCAAFIRAAFDESLRSFCSRMGVQVPYRMSPADFATIDLWNAAKVQGWAVSSAPGLISDVEAYRSILLDDLDFDLIKAIDQTGMQAALNAMLPQPVLGTPAASAPALQTRLDVL
jgi:hypothetical protein